MINVKKIYCPYTDLEIPESDSNIEHIIPLSLGGHDNFTLRAEAKTNAKLGSEIDGKISNDFLMLIKRRDNDARGHTGKEPEPVLKKAKDASTGRPVQLNLGKNLQVWDSMDKKQLPPNGMNIEASFKLELEPSERFLAKTFLSAGYFVYGNLFRQKVRHQDLRLLMKGQSKLTDKEVDSIQTRMFRRFQGGLDDPTQKQEYEEQKLYCNLVRGSLVVFFPSKDNTLYMFCGILGEYMGMLGVPADIQSFPLVNEHELGHVVIISGGRMVRGSYREFLLRLLPEIEKIEERTKQAAAKSRETSEEN